MTAVEWLVEDLIERDLIKKDDYIKSFVNSSFEKAKEMEKKQGYSEEEVVSFVHKFLKEHQPQLPYLIGGVNMWFQQHKKK